jgi:hypothetical protein
MCRHFSPFFLQSLDGNDQPCVPIVYDTYVHARMLHPARVSVQVELTRAANARLLHQAPFERLFFLKKRENMCGNLHLPSTDG